METMVIITDTMHLNLALDCTVSKEGKLVLYMQRKLVSICHLI